MDFNRFTEKLQEGIRAAQGIASSRGHQQIDVEHLLLALLEQERIRGWDLERCLERGWFGTLRGRPGSLIRPLGCELFFRWSSNHSAISLSARLPNS